MKKKVKNKKFNKLKYKKNIDIYFFIILDNF